MVGNSGWDASGAGTVGKAGLDDSTVKENGRVGIGGSLAGREDATSATEVV